MGVIDGLMGVRVSVVYIVSIMDGMDDGIFTLVPRHAFYTRPIHTSHGTRAAHGD